MRKKQYVQSASRIAFFTCKKYNQSESRVVRLNQSQRENSNGFQRGCDRLMPWERGCDRLVLMTSIVV